MKIDTPKNINYACTVVKLEQFRELAGCDNVKGAIIFGCQVIVSKDTPLGQIGLFFPVETALSKEFLGPNNLYRKAEFGNVDPEKKGFFEEHGRVKCMKFRGYKSEGFYVPISFINHIEASSNLLKVGDIFDILNDIAICWKYTPRGRAKGTFVGQPKTKKAEDRIVDGQFRFHIDTENLRRNVHKIQPDDIISITDKWHGTSAIVANLLIKKELKWYERFAKKLGLDIRDTEYGITWASRKVVKGVNGDTKKGVNNYYSTDIWGTVSKEISERVPRGYTIYGEIVGFTEDGGAIQKGYHYGCMERQHQFLVYRITSVNEDGVLIELSWPQIKRFCHANHLDRVKELYYGRAGDYDGDVDSAQADIRSWQEEFLGRIERDFVYDQQCPFNAFEVPSEGVVVRVEKLDVCESYKCKSFLFLKAESDSLDKGEVDMETEQSEEAA